jgi:hypothetical protein
MAGKTWTGDCFVSHKDDAQNRAAAGTITVNAKNNFD